MKLYATTTSERASKGQGGNEFLNIDIFIYDEVNPLYQIKITPDDMVINERGYSNGRLWASHKDIRQQFEMLEALKKGKKQKGE